MTSDAERALSLLVNAARVSPPLREAVATVETELRRLQVLIDVLASAARMCDEHPVGTDEESYAVHLWEEALDALLAAATKGNE